MISGPLFVRYKKKVGMKAGNKAIFFFMMLWMIMAGTAFAGAAGMAGTVLLAKGKKARVRIIFEARDATSQFAGTELQRYLKQISGTQFALDTAAGYRKPAVRLTLDKTLAREAYRISTKGSDLLIAGGSGSGVLYGVYDVLRRLGCRWPAPAYSFYHGSSTCIPRRDSLSITLRSVIREAPAMAIRKLDVEEGRSHTLSNLLQLIDWMPKFGFNTLMVPLNYGGWGKVKWDRWRNGLTPALKKRGLMIEVGGHGYQNFLNASMEDSMLFKEHPDWFGKDKNCNPSPEEYEVFNTADSGALRYFIANILSYLQRHPEIDIFDFWPPDGARWADCPALKSLGSGQDRQARLANLVDQAIRKLRPGLRLEIIAYAKALLPPETVSLNPDILVDFCPIDQSYERQIYDTMSRENNVYAKALHAWRKAFSGDIGLYSYYRKYGWHSLPNVIPYYIAKDLRWYKKVPLQGVSVYCEPGDWATFALNYYTLGRLAWNPRADVDSLVKDFCRTLYGRQAASAIRVYAVLGQTVRLLGNIPFTTLKSPERLAAGIKSLSRCEAILDSAVEAAGDAANADNLRKLALAAEYARRDLMILKVKGQPSVASMRVRSMVRFLEDNKDQGVFLMRRSDNVKRYLGYYGLNE